MLVDTLDIPIDLIVFITYILTLCWCGYLFAGTLAGKKGWIMAIKLFRGSV